MMKMEDKNMSRLTESGYEFKTDTFIGGTVGKVRLSKLLEKLQAYEDTGLEPEEVVTLTKKNARGKWIHKENNMHHCPNCSIQMRDEESLSESDRVKYGEGFYYILFYPNISVAEARDYREPFDNNCYNSNNYFFTEARAEQAAERIKLLLKLEKVHSDLCPGFKPNWEDLELLKYYVYYDHVNRKFKYAVRKGDDCGDIFNAVCFPDLVTASLACDLLNDAESCTGRATKGVCTCCPYCDAKDGEGGAQR